MMLINETKKQEQMIKQKIEEAKLYLNKTDFKMTIDYYETMTTEEQLNIVTKRAAARAFIIENEV